MNKSGNPGLGFAEFVRKEKKSQHGFELRETEKWSNSNRIFITAIFHLKSFNKITLVVTHAGSSIVADLGVECCK